MPHTWHIDALERQVSALKKEVTALKLQLEERPMEDELALLDLRKKKLLNRLETTPHEQRPIVLAAIARLDCCVQSLRQL